MKRLLFLLMAALLLAACGADKEYKQQLKEAEKRLEEAKEDTKRAEEISKQIDETNKMLTETAEQMGVDQTEDADYIEELSQDELNELFKFDALGLDDTLVDIAVENNEIKATVEVADHKMIDDKNILAETIYSRAGDTFLQYEGWDVLTIEFVDLGEISMNRNEKETNEYGMDYFPTEEIAKQLE